MQQSVLKAHNSSLWFCSSDAEACSVYAQEETAQHFMLDRTSVCARFRKMVSAGEDSGPDRAWVVFCCWLLQAVCPAGKRIWTASGSFDSTEITGRGLYGSLCSAQSEPGTCSLSRAAGLAVVRNLSYLKIFPVPPLTAGQASGKKVMQHLSPSSGWARYMTLAQKGLKGPEKLKQGRCCWNGVCVKWCREQKAWDGGTGLAGAGNQHVAETSWFHSYLSALILG